MINKYLFKYIVIGYLNVGKTSIITKFITKKCDEYYEPTLGVTLSIKNVNIDDDDIKF